MGSTSTREVQLKKQKQRMERPDKCLLMQLYANNFMITQKIQDVLAVPGQQNANISIADKISFVVKEIEAQARYLFAPEKM